MRVWIACALVACGRLRFEQVPQDDATPQTPQKLYVAESNAIEVFTIDPDGGLRQLAVMPTQVSQVVAIALDASGKYAVVAGTAVASFAIDATGALGLEHDSGAVMLRSIAAHTTAATFYGIDSTGCRVHELSLDRASGAIAEVGSIPLAVPCGELFVSVDPLGRWIFIPGSGATRGIDVGALDATGHLLSVKRSGIGGSSMIASVSDPSGKYLYLADNGADGVFGFAIDQQTGAVSTTALPGTPAFALQYSQVLVAFDPTGTSLYAFNESDGAYHFTFDAGSGGISAKPATTGAANSPCDPSLYSAVFTSDGKYVYGADQFTQGIFAYAIDPATGVLGALPGSPFAASGVAMSIAISR